MNSVAMALTSGQQLMASLDEVRSLEGVQNQLMSGCSTPANAPGSGVPVPDLDLLDVLSGCMDSQDDVQELAAGLMEMENELKSITDDTSFLQFPSILQEVFPLDSESSPNSGNMAAAIAPSVSDEYLCPREQSNASPGSESVITDHQVISNHPLVPLVKQILQRRSTESIQYSSQLSEIKSYSSTSSDIDAFMAHTASIATQLSEDASVVNMTQSIENEGSFFTREMSMFCQNLLKSDSIPIDQNLQSNKPVHQLTSLKFTAKENKVKPKTKSGEVKKQRVRISQRNTQILREWLLEHADNPFPTDSEKDILCLRTGLTLSKLNVWFVNSRRRILAPLGLRNYHKEIAHFNNK